MKKYVLLLGVVLVLFAGFALRERYVRTATQPSFAQSFAGTWVYVGETEYGAHDSFELKLRTSGTTVSGTFHAVLSSGAQRLDTGAFVGEYDAKTNKVNGSWYGDRGDNGTARLTLDPAGKTISWSVETAHQDEPGDYSVAKKMVLTADVRDQLSSQEEENIKKMVTGKLQSQIDLRDSYVYMEIGRIIGNYMSVFMTIEGKNTPGSDDFLAYLEKNNGDWHIVLGPARTFVQKDYARMGIPPILQMY
jgi:hypothetical protein